MSGKQFAYQQLCVIAGCAILAWSNSDRENLDFLSSWIDDGEGDAGPNKSQGCLEELFINPSVDLDNIFKLDFFKANILK